MENKGYVIKSQDIDYEECVKTFNQNECNHIYADNIYGTNWNTFVDDLKEKDCVILISFDNAFRNRNQMIFFIKLCVTMNIRIVSIEDKIDTHDIMFDESTTARTLVTICKIFQKKGESNTSSLSEQSINKPLVNKLIKEKTIINMYHAGYSINEIKKKVNYKSKTHIYVILRNYKISCNHPTQSVKKQK